MVRQGANSGPLVISASGLAEPELATLAGAIEFVSGQGINCRFIGNDNLQGHLVVVDVDSARGQASLMRLRQGQVKMLMARRPPGGEDVVAITKPLDRDELGALLARVCFRLQLQLEKSVTPDDPPEPAMKPAKAGDSLFQTLLDAKHRKVSVVVSQAGLPVLYVDGVNDVVKSALDAQALRQLLAVSPRDVSVGMGGDDVLPAHWTQWQVMPLDHALWSAGLQWRSGTLLPGLDMSKPLKLKAWPNFTRTDFSPEHLKLSALLAARALTPYQLSNNAGVDAQEVMCFVNAAYAVGLLYVETQPVTMTVASRSRDGKRQGLLVRLARRLGL